MKMQKVHICITTLLSWVILWASSLLTVLMADDGRFPAYGRVENLPQKHVSHFSANFSNNAVLEETMIVGLGTYDSPYLVSDAPSLMRFRDLVNDGSLLTSNVFVRQTADIDMSFTNEWCGIGTSAFPFEGTYDGAYHKIVNLNLTVDSNIGGFFGRAKEATIENLRIEDVTSHTNFSGAVVVGRLQGGIVRNVVTSGKLRGFSSSSIAGLIGSCWGTRILVESCTNRVDLETSSSGAAGLVFSVNASEYMLMTNCLNTGYVSVVQSKRMTQAVAGGLVGTSSTPLYIQKCRNTGNLVVEVQTNALGYTITSYPTNVVYNSTLMYNVVAAGAIARLCRRSSTSWFIDKLNPSVYIDGFMNSGSIIVSKVDDERSAIASGVLGDPSWFPTFFRCPFILNNIAVLTSDIHAHGDRAVSAAFFGGNTRYTPSDGYGTQLLYGRAPTSLLPFGNWDFEVGGYNTTKKDGDYTVYYICDIQEGSDGGEEKDVDEDVSVITQREIPFSESWGAWTIEDDSSYVKPCSTTGIDDLGRIAWRARDAMMRNGQFGCLPPSETPIVLSVGAFSFSGTLTGKNGEELEMDQECGVAVWHVRIFEDPKEGVLRMTIGGVEIAPISMPIYAQKAWTESVYGQSPAWLSGEEKEAWYAQRSRSRVEMFATLVPTASYAAYQENQEADEAAIDADDRKKILIREFSPSTSTNSLHVLNVRMPNTAAVTVLGSSDLSGTNWTVNGVGTLSAGRSANGVSSSSKAFFVKVVADATAATGTTSGDSDGDGISDVLEEHVYHTDPNKASTSGDGLTDGEKIYRYGLSAKTGDSDGDGFDDEEEIAMGLDPKVANPGAFTTIRYTYDDDDRLTGTYFGNNGRSTTKLSPVGNPLVIEKRGAK